MKVPRVGTIVTALLMTVITVSIITRIAPLKRFVFNEGA